MKRVAVSQPRYLPAVNYLQRLYACDVFILLDDVQHQRRAYEHRNKLLIDGQPKWLSIPVDRVSTSRPIISKMKVKETSWVDQHVAMISRAYKKAHYYDSKLIHDLYHDLSHMRLVVDILEAQLFRTCRILGIPWKDKILRSTDIKCEGAGSLKLAQLTKGVGGDIYVSGPNGRNYIERNDFSGLSIEYHDFKYPIYEQGQDAFVPWMAWLDCAMHAGLDEVRRIVKSRPQLNSE